MVSLRNTTTVLQYVGSSQRKMQKLVFSTHGWGRGDLSQIALRQKEKKVPPRFRDNTGEGGRNETPIKRRPPPLRLVSLTRLLPALSPFSPESAESVLWSL